MNCLVLAFETPDDLPCNTKQFTRIDAYGDVDVTDGPALVTIHDEFFEVSNDITTQYDQCYINHPDPWGEPRNWMQAFAGLGECLQGELRCVLWYPHELVVIEYLLTSLLRDAVSFVHAEHLPGENEECEVAWDVDATATSTEMQHRYDQCKNAVLQGLYNDVGEAFQHMSLSTAVEQRKKFQ